MNQPIYETEVDKKNEIGIIPLLEAKFNCEVRRNQKLSCCDYSFLRDSMLVALGEYKKRKNIKYQYPTYMLAATKFTNACTMARTLGVACILIVEWTDQIGYVRLDKIEFDTGIGGRLDRDDPQDIEPVIYIDVNAFANI